MSKKIVAASALAAAAVAGGLVFAPAASATPVENSAYAIAGTGLIKVDKTPFVTNEHGFTQKSLVELNLPEEGKSKLLSLKALNAQAGDHSAKASIAKVSVDLGVLKGIDILNLEGDKKPLLSATAISASCVDGKGKSSVAKARIANIPLDVAAPANTVIEVPGVAKITLNEQKKNKDGSLTVTAIAIDLLNGTQTLKLASATCSADDKATPTTKPSAPSTSKPAGDDTKAPRPVPVKATLAVTG